MDIVFVSQFVDRRDVGVGLAKRARAPRVQIEIVDRSLAQKFRGGL